MALKRYYEPFRDFQIKTDIANAQAEVNSAKATVQRIQTELDLAYIRAIRNIDSEQVVAYPFIGGGVNLNTSNDFKVDSLLVTGVDIPLSNRFTATGRLNVGFGENKTDVGLLLGVGYSL